MPIVVDCPSCNRKLRVPDDMLGKKVKCPRCGSTFTASENGKPDTAEERQPPKKSSGVRERPSGAGERPSSVSKRPKPPPEPEEDERIEDEEQHSRRRPRPAAEQEDEDDRPRRRSREDEDDDDEFYRPRKRKGSGAANWRQVLRGLTMILIAILVSVIAPIILALAAVLAGGVMIGSILPAAPGPDGRPTAPPNLEGVKAGAVALVVIGVLYILTSLAAWALKIVGHIFCLPSPMKHGAKTLAMVTLGLVGGHAACWLLGQVVSILDVGLAASAPMTYRGGGSSGASGLIGLLSYVLWFSGFIVFLFYLRAVALAVGEKRLASHVVRYMIAVGVSIALSILGFCTMILIFVMGVGAAAYNASQKSSNSTDMAMGSLMGAGVLGLLCGIFLILLFLGMLIWYIVLVVLTRSAVGRHLARTG